MANNIDVKDAAAATVTMKTTDNAGVHTAHHNVDSSALPTGAATEATLASALTSLQTIDNAISGSGINVSQIGGSAARTADLDTDAGTDTYPVIGVMIGGPGGAYPVTETDPFPTYVIGAVNANATQAGSWTVSLSAEIPTGTNNIGDVDIASIPAATSGGAANVSSSATSTTILASNSGRKGFTVYNDSTQILYLKFGATATSTSFHVKMAADSYYESPAGFIYTGIIDGIWASANGAARVGEFT